MVPELLSGRKIGTWTVSEATQEITTGRMVCRCVCVCGKEKWLRPSGLDKKLKPACRTCARQSRHSEADDLSNLPFGSWTVIGGPEKRGKENRRYWLCRCKCRYEAYVSAHNLTQGGTLGCRKCRGRRVDVPPEVGAEFGPWTVLREAGTNKHQLLLCECRCRCGFVRTIQATLLRTGRLPICSACMPASHQNAVYNVIWSKLLWGAQSRGLEVTVTQESLFLLLEAQGYRCALTGLLLVVAVDAKTQQAGGTTASVDRIDANQGYVPENVHWVHKVVNRARWELSVDDFVHLCRLVVAKADGLELGFEQPQLFTPACVDRKQRRQHSSGSDHKHGGSCS